MVVPVIALAMLGGPGEAKAALDSLGVSFLTCFMITASLWALSASFPSSLGALAISACRHILIRFMAIKNEDEVRKSRKVAIAG